MKTPDELRRENEALRDRNARLSAAVLRVSASLDLDTVLREIVDGARGLTGARYGLITTVDDAGRPHGFVSSGMASEEHERLESWRDGPRLFEHFRDLPGALRLPDARPYIRSLGFAADAIPAGSFQGTPMRHQGALVGHFFLVAKDGGSEFSDEDEETLMLFASQAAAAIANARTHHEQQRTRANLEALVETSPVGVAVFDARTGGVVSINKEARRLVEGLCLPGQSAEELLPVLTTRQADGQEFVLSRFPLAQVLRDAKAVRAEEIVLSVPDGRSVRTLVNATPIHSADGEVESVVVAMQDLAPLDEVERMRTEFLSLVSHELRAPLISIKGAAATVLGAAPPPDPAEVQQIFRIIDEQADHMRGLIADLLDAGRIETGTLSVAPEPAAVAGLVDQARNTFVSGGSRQVVHIDLPLDLPRVLADRQRIVQVLNNLLANAARHAPESSPIRVSAVRDGVHVAITVADEGRGIPPEQLPNLFRKHAQVGGADGIGGTGLGLAICKGLVEAHGGRIRAESGGLGMGTRITFTIPVAAEVEVAGGAVEGHGDIPQAGRELPRILVVDDDPQALRQIRDTLAGAGYAPVVTGDPQALPSLVKLHRPRLVLLDLMLPGTDGIELMQGMTQLAELPVIFISAYGRDETVARALGVGAVDYIVKPFSPTELTARVAAVLRRQAEPEPFRLNDLAIDYQQRRVTVAGRPVRLTATEFELLRVLAVNAGRVMTYEALQRRVWDDRHIGHPKVVHAFVKKLRRKLSEDATRPAYIFNEHGVGYRMPRPGEAGEP